MLGFTDGTPNSSYEDIDYAFYMKENTYEIQIYESNTAPFQGGIRKINDIFEIIYDGNSVRYYQNNNLLRITYPNNNDLQLNLDSSLLNYTSSELFQIIELGDFDIPYFTGGSSAITTTEYKFNYPDVVLDLQNDANTSISPNYIVTKSGGSNTQWDAQVYSNNSFTGFCHLTFRAVNINNYYMVGISTVPTTNSSYTDIDYCWYIRAVAPKTRIYKNGSSVYTGGEVDKNDIFDIKYTGSTVEFYHNGILKHTESGLTDNIEFYLDSSIEQIQGDIFQILQFSQYDSLVYNYLTVPQNIAPSLIETDFTIEFWLKIENTSPEFISYPIYTQGEYVDGKYFHIYIYHEYITGGGVPDVHNYIFSVSLKNFWGTYSNINSYIDIIVYI